MSAAEGRRALLFRAASDFNDAQRNVLVTAYPML
jgi:hypothetical protein